MMMIRKYLKKIKKTNNLNNKGMTLIELLICFVIVSVIVVALFNTIMNYKTKEQTEDVKKTVIAYKNVITKIIQTDIIKHDLASYELVEEPTTTSGENAKEEWKIKLTFNETFEDGSTEKDLTIVRGNKTNYIKYPDVVKDGSIWHKQEIQYDLESTDVVNDVDVISTDNTNKTKYNDIRFAYVSLKQYGNIFYLDIPIYHSELGTNYHINIVAPLNYLKSANS